MKAPRDCASCVLGLPHPHTVTRWQVLISLLQPLVPQKLSSPTGKAVPRWHLRLLVPRTVPVGQTLCEEPLNKTQRSHTSSRWPLLSSNSHLIPGLVQPKVGERLLQFISCHPAWRPPSEGFCHLPPSRVTAAGLSTAGPWGLADQEVGPFLLYWQLVVVGCWLTWMQLISSRVFPGQKWPWF